MVKQQRANRIPLGVIVGLSVAAVGAAGFGAWWALKPQPQTTSSIPSTPQQQQSLPVPLGAQTAHTYWLTNTGNHLELVTRAVKVATNKSNDAVLKAAINKLLAGPTDADVSSTIPEGTQLLSLTVQNDGIHVNLSQEFTQGGGSASMSGRVAQVLYTATSLQPNDKVWINVEGKPLEILGGEGLLLEQPLTRQDFEKNFTL